MRGRYEQIPHSRQGVPGHLRLISPMQAPTTELKALVTTPISVIPANSPQIG